VFVLRRLTRMLLRFDPEIQHVHLQIGGPRMGLPLFDLGFSQLPSRGLVEETYGLL